jgi:hypothetical protein
VLGLLPVLALLFLALAVALWALTLVLQAWLYTEPVTQLYWRAPLASLIVTAFIFYWCFLDYRSPGRYGALHDVSGVGREDEQFDTFWSVKKNQEVPFTARRTAQGRYEYRDASGKLWSRSDTEGVVQAIIVENKDHEKIRFEAELTPEGKFTNVQGQPVRYVEVGGRGRVMTDDYPGLVRLTRWSRIVANLFLNFLLMGLLFAGLWPLLRFQWSHALGLAVVFWLALIFILPTLFKRAEDLAKQKPSPEPSAGLSGYIKAIASVSAAPCRVRHERPAPAPEVPSAAET